MLSSLLYVHWRHLSIQLYKSTVHIDFNSMNVFYNIKSINRSSTYISNYLYNDKVNFIYLSSFQNYIMLFLKITFQF